MTSSIRGSRLVRLALVASLLLAGHTASAQVLFHNGDADGLNALTSQHDAYFGLDYRLYDNFTVTGADWLVTGLMGDFWALMWNDYSLASSWTTAYWEIRSGVAPGSDGTLLYSGTSAASMSPITIPVPWTIDNAFRTVVSGFTPFSLTPGTYWMTIAPIPVELGGGASLWSTSGTNGVNALHDGQIYQHVPTFPQYQPVGLYTNESVSYGVLGTTTATPEPATLTLTALGLGALGAGRFRRRRGGARPHA